MAIAVEKKSGYLTDLEKTLGTDEERDFIHQFTSNSDKNGNIGLKRNYVTESLDQLLTHLTE